MQHNGATYWRFDDIKAVAPVPHTTSYTGEHEPMKPGIDTRNVKQTLSVNGKDYDYYSLPEAAKQIGDISRLPFSLKVLLENMLRFDGEIGVGTEDAQAVADWLGHREARAEIAYRPARILLQDFTGVPAVVDLASMREAMVEMGGDPKKVNPIAPVDLVIDHSVMVDTYATQSAYDDNVKAEFSRNKERYEFLRWGQEAFENFRVVPPGTGICHQVNLEYLAQTVWTATVDGREVAYPDTLVGTDSHTTMVNGMAVLGWGVGGIEAEAAMLGQPISMRVPEVIGFKLTGNMVEGTTATDLVLRIVEMLRAKGVVGKFVEFYGPGVAALTLADRATIANMAPEYGATCGFFPIDAETCRYLSFTGRDKDRVALVETYAKAQGMWLDDNTPEPIFSDTLALDLNEVVPAVAGPKRPQDRVSLSDVASAFSDHLAADLAQVPQVGQGSAPVEGADYTMDAGDVVIAAITSCTNTSNPSVMVAAGLVAKKAREKGITTKPWVKTSLAPGSQVVSDYLEAARLQDDLDAIGFHLVGYGCTTCIGNSGPLKPEIEAAINQGNVRVASVLSGNRNFEGRVHALSRFNYLASPPLVVAYAIAGNMNIDIMTDPIAQDQNGEDVFLADIWPSNQEVQETMEKAITDTMYADRYANVFDGTEDWRQINVSGSLTYDWDEGSTYVQYPPFFDGMAMEPRQGSDILGARPLAILADSITTDHISPAGAIKKDSPAGMFLMERQIPQNEFNSYGARRGNHNIMMRGTFANIRIKNQMLGGSVEGGYSVHYPSGDKSDIYDIAMRYKAEGTPLVVVGGKEYGTGSSRDWAAKGTMLLGVKAVIVESFERIHRSNLIGMGVLPLQFKGDDNRESLNLKGDETWDITGLTGALSARQDIDAKITYPDGTTKIVTLLARLDTADEVTYYKHGGILHYVLRNMAKA